MQYDATRDEFLLMLVAVGGYCSTKVPLQQEPISLTSTTLELENEETSETSTDFASNDIVRRMQQYYY